MSICQQFVDSNIFKSNIQHSMLAFHKEKTFLLKYKFQGIMPTTMLAYLVNCKKIVTNMYMNDISNIICQLYHLHLEQYFFRQQHDLSL